ncbi:MAG TPA: metalloregulator ArsR/SmtB family transcription factor [Acidimicrobiales bacterium]|jgi:DNA-binding transcriptional ArsR family regulator|nr:metalloregulator ArsR/SmtB family transcription factor [Acidimicrobiales bacterium]
MTLAVWPALTEPTRRAVLDLLRTRPHDVGEIVTALGVSQPKASKHLRVLKDAGLVRVTGVAQRRLYSIEPAPLASLDAWLAPYRQLWNGRLDDLGRHLEEMEEE